MRKPIDKLEMVDISRLKRCHIYNGNTLSDVKVSFQDVKGMRKKLETLYEGRVNQAFVESAHSLSIIWGQRMSGIIAFDEISLRRKRSLYEVFFYACCF